MFEALLISAGGVWIALFALAVLAACIFSIENDDFMIGLVVIFLTFVILQFVFGYPILGTILSNPLVIVFYLAVYIAIGATYAAFWRMNVFLEENKESILSNYKYWKHQKENAENDSYEAFLDSSMYNFSVRKNKDVVASWVLLWPAGVLWELSHKPLIWVWNSVYFSLGKSLEKINKSKATEILNDGKK